MTDYTVVSIDTPSKAELQQQLDEIQHRNNFHPWWGARQVQNSDPEHKAAYKLFSAAMKQAERLGYLDITVWYDGAGLFERGVPRTDRRIPLFEIVVIKARINAFKRQAAAERATRPPTRKELKRKAWREGKRLVAQSKAGAL